MVSDAPVVVVWIERAEGEETPSKVKPVALLSSMVRLRSGQRNAAIVYRGSERASFAPMDEKLPSHKT